MPIVRWADTHGSVLIPVSHVYPPTIIVPPIVISVPSWIPLIGVVHSSPPIAIIVIVVVVPVVIIVVVVLVLRIASIVVVIVLVCIWLCVVWHYVPPYFTVIYCNLLMPGAHLEHSYIM